MSISIHVMRFLKRVCISLFLALWLEFFYKFGATNDIDNFIGSIPIYFIYLALFNFAVIKLELDEKLLICLFLGGAIGIAAEWFLIGNAPWSNPKAFQLGMFVFHATYPVLGIILSSATRYSEIRRLCLITFLLFTILLPAGFLIPDHGLRFAWFIWLPLLPYFICFTAVAFKQGKAIKASLTP